VIEYVSRSFLMPLHDGRTMTKDYHIFEQKPDGPIWRASVPSLFNAHRKLAELAESTNNECFAIHLATGQIVARVNGVKQNKSAHAIRTGPFGGDSNMRGE